RLQGLRKQFALDFGFVMSPVRVRQDGRLPPQRYAIDFFGSQMAGGELRADKLLAINPGGKRAALEGEKAQEPTYGLPALWIEPDKRQFARGAGYTLVDPETVLVTHFSEVVKHHAAELLTRAETERLVGRVADKQASLIEELTPNLLSYSDIQKVLQQLLREQVSVRNIEAILEVLVDQGKATKDPAALTEKARERLGANICQSVADTRGEVQVLTLAPDLERRFLGATRDIEKTGGQLMALEPRRFEQFLMTLGKQCEAMLANNLLPVLLCPGPVRRYLRQLVGHALPHMTVLGLNEIPPSAKIRSFAIVALPGEPGE
ncbi:MAG TPA: FHIPEP family type III secretion protein, partial [Gammaproteobacteria bacterium]|nr:FHIPEP family type III secretion protein [Gammaproteobacteria bacterium]